MYALERLPAVPPGTFIGYGVTQHWKGRFSDMYYVEFRISTEEFEIQRGGSKDSGIGHDSYSNPGWFFDVQGNRETGCNLSDLEYEVINLLENGAEIQVDDESDIDFSEHEN